MQQERLGLLVLLAATVGPVVILPLVLPFVYRLSAAAGVVVVLYPASSVVVVVVAALPALAVRDQHRRVPLAVRFIRRLRLLRDRWAGPVLSVRLLSRPAIRTVPSMAAAGVAAVLLLQ